MHPVTVTRDLGVDAGHRCMKARRAIRSLDFDSDPADELIAATSLVHNVPLLTRDRRLRRSKVVPLVD
jgi:PIN domain nuclease of toxin-antitoxin system